MKPETSDLKLGEVKRIVGKFNNVSRSCMACVNEVIQEFDIFNEDYSCVKENLNFIHEEVETLWHFFNELGKLRDEKIGSRNDR